MVVTALRSHGGKNGRNTFVKQFELITVTGCLCPARRSNMDAEEKKQQEEENFISDCRFLDTPCPWMTGFLSLPAPCCTVRGWCRAPKLSCAVAVQVTTLCYVCFFCPQFLRMVDACASFLTEALQPDNCVGILRLADAHSLSSLKQQVQNYIIQNFTQVLHYEEFLELPADVLCSTLKSDDLYVTEEAQVFETVMSWVRYKESERFPLLPYVLENVRLPLLDPWYFVETVEADQLIRQCPDVFPLLQEARMYHLSGNEVSKKEGICCSFEMPHASAQKSHGKEALLCSRKRGIHTDLSLIGTTEKSRLASPVILTI